MKMSEEVKTVVKRVVSERLANEALTWRLSDAQAIELLAELLEDMRTEHAKDEGRQYKRSEG